jgi:hypothetical protein
MHVWKGKRNKRCAAEGNAEHVVLVGVNVRYVASITLLASYNHMTQPNFGSCSGFQHRSTDRNGI